MAPRVVVAVTDQDWFEFLRASGPPTEVNFWAPSARSFKALSPGELFLFKLHSPHNFIVGGGVFAYSTNLPSSLAWDAFGIANSARSYAEMRKRISQYRRQADNPAEEFVIGCRILTQPFFLNREEWIPVPESWSNNTVSFKTYSSAESDGLDLWNRLEQYVAGKPILGMSETPERYGPPVQIKPRLGQGAFRVLVTDIYLRRCAVSGEKTLPALEAAHIRPYAEGGNHEAPNGLLLRRDIHSLFDAGYVTVTPQLRFEVSRKIKEEFDNGRHYYALHGAEVFMPPLAAQRADQAALTWHNNFKFKG